MKKSNFFVSLVIVIHNDERYLRGQLLEVEKHLTLIAEDYEIIIVDNGSDDLTFNLLQSLTQKEGFANIQVYSLTKEVNKDVATWVGIENSLGDVVVAFDPFNDDLNIIYQMLELAADGRDIVFAKNNNLKNNFSYGFVYSIFNFLFKIISGVNLSSESPSFRLISKKVINYLLKFPYPTDQYRFLTAMSGFSRFTINYKSNLSMIQKKSINQGFERGISLLVSTTKAPLRLVNFFTLFGAMSNLIYSFYVLYVVFTKADVEPGWVTLSLQQSGMFFLISLVLFFLGEYILNIAKLSSEGPKYHIAQELTSAIIRHREKLNVTH